MTQGVRVKMWLTAGERQRREIIERTHLARRLGPRDSCTSFRRGQDVHVRAGSFALGVGGRGGWSSGTRPAGLRGEVLRPRTALPRCVRREGLKQVNQYALDHHASVPAPTELRRSRGRPRPRHLRPVRHCGRGGSQQGRPRRPGEGGRGHGPGVPVNRAPPMFRPPCCGTVFAPMIDPWSCRVRAVFTVP